MNELFVQVEVGLPSSKLVDRAREMLGVSTDVALAKLLRLWLATMAVGCHGRVGERSDVWIEEAVAWQGAPGAFAAFVRLHHLDGDGVIRDWMDKYGAVEVGRAKATRKKRLQRAALRGEVIAELVPGTPAGQIGGPSGDVPRTLLQSPISPVKALTTGNIQSEHASDGELAAHRADAMQTLSIFLTTYDFGQWRAVVEGYVRSSKKPVNVIRHLELWLTGEMGYRKREPGVIGFAINQYAASGEAEFKAALFDGFVRRVKGQMERNVGAEARQMEDARLAQERRDREDREQDDRDQQMLNDFERTSEEKFMALKAKAEAGVDKRYKGEMRANMVRAALIALVRKEAR